MEDIRQEPSLGELFSTLTRETQDYVRLEVELARAEMAEKAREAGKGMTGLTVGAAIAAAGLLCLLAAAVTGLSAFLAQWIPATTTAWLSPLLLGAVVTALGTLFISRGREKIKMITLVPRKTAQSLKESKEWLKQELSS
jgi:putative superfamily III holin-X